MTRLEAGAVTLEWEPCDIQDLVGCALAAMDMRLDTTMVTVNVPENCPLVPLDMVLMTQVLLAESSG